MAQKVRLWRMSIVVLAVMFMSAGSSGICQDDEVVGQERLTASQESAKRLYDLDDTMMANYADTQRLVGESQSPVIIVMMNRGGGKYILHRKGSEISVEPVPALYQQMKSVSHTIVGIFEIISPYFASPEIDNWRPKLTEYNKMLKEALSTLKDVGMPPDVEKRCRTILEGGVKFTDEALKTGTFNSEGYSKSTS